MGRRRGVGRGRVGIVGLWGGRVPRLLHTFWAERRQAGSRLGNGINSHQHEAAHSSWVLQLKLKRRAPGVGSGPEQAEGTPAAGIRSGGRQAGRRAGRRG